VTLTDPDMSRYMMPMADAVGLCFKAMTRMEGGEVFILKMPRVAIGDLVEVLVEAYAPVFGLRPRDIEIERIGARAGEKHHEALLTEEEAAFAEEIDGMYVVRAGARLPRHASVEGGRGQEPLLPRNELRELLDASGWLDPKHLPGLG
jgi:FlaA1/EpsC-like NDP-sugar epimerase